MVASPSRSLVQRARSRKPERGGALIWRGVDDLGVLADLRRPSPTLAALARAEVPRSSVLCCPTSTDNVLRVGMHPKKTASISPARVVPELRPLPPKSAPADFLVP